MIQLARLLDEKAKQLIAGSGHINENMLLAMVGLLIADELTETQKKLEQHPAEGQISAATEQSFAQVAKPCAKPDFTALDEELSEVLNKLTAQIKMLANEIKTM